jgi:hypothetical protein
LWYLFGFFVIKAVLTTVMPATFAVAIAVIILLFVKWI